MTTDAEHQERPYLTVVEAAHLTGLSVKTLTRWAENGWLPSVLVGGEMLLSRAHFEVIVIPPKKVDE
jgi:excisionase family DNA binding protein